MAKALRVADFLELGELFAKDALERAESCGGHFREESQTPEGEALRDDKNFTFVSAWEYNGEPSKAKLHKEVLEVRKHRIENTFIQVAMKLTLKIWRQENATAKGACKPIHWTACPPICPFWK